MERKITEHLLKWKKDLSRKPLVIYGNKQVGKTYSVIKFGETEYKNVAYFNTDNNEAFFDILKKEKTVERLVMKLSFLVNETILTKDTLMIFDNVKDIEVINMAKIFSKHSEDYHLIMISSSKENLIEFKGEELAFKQMNAMDFEEYLKAIDNGHLIDFIKTSFKNNKAMPFHNIALDFYDDYLATGALPEAVKSSIDNKNSLLGNAVYSKIIDSYKKEMSNLENLIDIPRAIEVFESVPYQLMKTNKKFQYGLMKSGSRSKNYEKALTHLHNNGIVSKCFKISEVKQPLSSARDKESFKLYLNDTGILYNMMNLNKTKFLTDINTKNIISENSIAITLSNLGFNLYYYQSEGKAEVSFVVQTRNGKVIPIELVDKNMSKAKSLGLFMSKFKVEEAIRITEDNFSSKKGIKYVPIYALFCLGDML